MIYSNVSCINSWKKVQLLLGLVDVFDRCMHLKSNYRKCHILLHYHNIYTVKGTICLHLIKLLGYLIFSSLFIFIQLLLLKCFLLVAMLQREIKGFMELTWIKFILKLVWWNMCYYTSMKPTILTFPAESCNKRR